MALTNQCHRDERGPGGEFRTPRRGGPERWPAPNPSVERPWSRALYCIKSAESEAEARRATVLDPNRQAALMAAKNLCG